jgi:hypothetical protein
MLLPIQQVHHVDFFSVQSDFFHVDFIGFSQFSKFSVFSIKLIVFESFLIHTIDIFVKKKKNNPSKNHNKHTS